MLSKQVGTSTVLTMSSTPQLFTATTFTGATPLKVRVATNSQPAYIAFNTTATSNTGILIPANTVEHFKLENTTITYAATTASNYLTTGIVQICYVSVLQAGTAGVISITPVA